MVRDSFQCLCHLFLLFRPSAKDFHLWRTSSCPGEAAMTEIPLGMVVLSGTLFAWLSVWATYSYFLILPHISTILVSFGSTHLSCVHLSWANTGKSWWTLFQHCDWLCESSHIPCFPVLRCLNCLAGSAHAAAGRFSWEVPSSLEAMNNSDMGFVPVFALSDGAFALKVDNH